MKRILAVLGLLVWLAGCSGEPFHLRVSEAAPSALLQQGIYLQGVSPSSDFGIALQDGLEDAGITILEKATGSATSLTISSLNERRSVSGYSSTRQVREFIHTVDVRFRVKATGVDERLEQSVHVERSQVYDGKYVLGTADEEVDIKDELRQEAVRLIILRLQALKQRS